MNRSRSILTVLCFFAVSLALLTHAQTSSPWMWGPIVGTVAEDMAVISWESSRPLSVDMHYGLSQVYDTSGTWDETLTFDRQEGRAEIWLRDLLPGMEYRFQLIAYEGDAVFPSKIGTFRTLDNDVRGFSFVAYGHTRSFPDRHKLVADTMAVEDPTASFVLHVGDLVETFSDDRLDNFLWAIADLARSTAYVAVVGSSSTNVDSYYESFALPQGGGISGEQWWVLEVGDLCLIGLDSTLDDPADGAAQEQVVWLRQTLAVSQAPLTIVACSAPLYSAAYTSGRNEQLVSLWEAVLRDGDVDVLLASLPGGYEHGYVGGIHYVNTGGGGGPADEIASGRAPGLVFIRSDILHYVRFTIADAAMRIEAVPVASVIDDEIYLTPTTGPIDSFVVRGE